MFFILSDAICSDINYYQANLNIFIERKMQLLLKVDNSHNHLNCIPSSPIRIIKGPLITHNETIVGQMTLVMP